MKVSLFLFVNLFSFMPQKNCDRAFNEPLLTVFSFFPHVMYFQRDLLLWPPTGDCSESKTLQRLKNICGHAAQTKSRLVKQ